jgi:hypothetical protein
MYAVSKGKPEAIAIANALIDTSLEDWFRLSFNQTPMTLSERAEMFDRTYKESINWLEEDRKDWQKIEEQDRFLDNGYR